MRKPILIFLALAFLLYWLTVADLPVDNRLSFGTITPIIKRIVEPARLAEPMEPVSTPVPREPAKTVDIQSWLESEAAKIGAVDPNPAQTRIRLKNRATRFDSKDLKTLKRLALEKSLAADARFLAVYLLSLSNSTGAIPLLKEVCFSRIPTMATDREHSDEIILRAQSLESLVQRMTPREARALLRELLIRTSDPILARQAQYWLSRLS